MEIRRRVTLYDVCVIMGREYTTEQSIGGIASPSVEWVLWGHPFNHTVKHRVRRRPIQSVVVDWGFNGFGLTRIRRFNGYPLTSMLVRGFSEGVARENAGAISITQTSIEMTNQTAQFH